MNSTSTITSKYQVVIPKLVRRNVKLLAGDKVFVQAVGNMVVIQKTSRGQSWANSLLGLGKEVWKGIDPVSYVRKERAAWKK